MGAVGDLDEGEHLVGARGARQRDAAGARAHLHARGERKVGERRARALRFLELRRARERQHLVHALLHCTPKCRRTMALCASSLMRISSAMRSASSLPRRSIMRVFLSSKGAQPRMMAPPLLVHEAAMP